MTERSQHIPALPISELWFAAGNDSSPPTQQALRLLEDLTEIMADAFVVRDLSRKQIVFANRAFENIWGRSRNQLYASDRLLVDAVHPEDLRAVRPLLEPANGESDETLPDHRIVLPSGEIHWVRIRSSTRKSELHHRAMAFLSAQDVTDYHRELDALHQKESEYRTLIESQDQMIVKVDPQGRLLYVSPSYCDMFGKSEQELLGHAFMPLVHEDDRERALTAMGQLGVPPHTCYLEQRVLTPTGWRWVAWNDKAILNEQGEVVSIVGVGRDVTDRRRHREELALAKEIAEKANREKDGFLALLSHELRTPLTPVLACVCDLEEDASVSPPVLESLHMIRRNIELESRLIDDLLDLTRISRGKLHLDPRSVDAHELLSNAINISFPDIKDKQIRFKQDLAATETGIIADPARIQQVFWNVIKNAVQFTPPEGRVGVRSFNEAGFFVTEVIDSGSGIEAEFLPRIFDAFEQAQRAGRHGGLGLGLAIARMVLDLHGGQIVAESGGRQRGSRFTMRLPLSDGAEAEGDKPAKPAAPPVQRSLRVLLVEDHPSTLQVFSRLLGKSGHTVTTATTVAGALEKASEGEFDLLISDIGLPDGSGLDVMKQLRGRKSLRAIALSGFGMDQDVNNSLDAGFRAHLTKPVGMQLLIETIGEVMRDG